MPSNPSPPSTGSTPRRPGDPVRGVLRQAQVRRRLKSVGAGGNVFRAPWVWIPKERNYHQSFAFMSFLYSFVNTPSSLVERETPVLRGPVVQTKTTDIIWRVLLSKNTTHTSVGVSGGRGVLVSSKTPTHLHVSFLPGVYASLKNGGVMFSGKNGHPWGGSFFRNTSRMSSPHVSIQELNMSCRVGLPCAGAGFALRGAWYCQLFE